MRTIMRVLWALITGVMLTACAQKPYAIALFAYVDGKVVGTQLQPAGSSLGECESIGVSVRKEAASQGLSLGFQCFAVPDGARVRHVRPRASTPSSGATTL